MKVFKLQPAPRVDGMDLVDGELVERTQLPYPFFVAETGEMRGIHAMTERAAIGFQRDLAVQQLDLHWRDYVLGDPEAAKGMYLVTESAEGNLSSQMLAIDSVEVREVEA